MSPDTNNTWLPAPNNSGEALSYKARKILIPLPATKAASVVCSGEMLDLLMLFEDASKAAWKIPS